MKPGGNRMRFLIPHSRGISLIPLFIFSKGLSFLAEFFIYKPNNFVYIFFEVTCEKEWSFISNSH
jgi:hypothetical protein